MDIKAGPGLEKGHGLWQVPGLGNQGRVPPGPHSLISLPLSLLPVAVQCQPSLLHSESDWQLQLALNQNAFSPPTTEYGCWCVPLDATTGPGRLPRSRQ